MARMWGAAEDDLVLVLEVRRRAHASPVARECSHVRDSLVSVPSLLPAAGSRSRGCQEEGQEVQQGQEQEEREEEQQQQASAIYLDPTPQTSPELSPDSSPASSPRCPHARMDGSVGKGGGERGYDNGRSDGACRVCQTGGGTSGYGLRSAPVWKSCLRKCVDASPLVVKYSCGRQVVCPILSCQHATSCIKTSRCAPQPCT